MQKSVTRLVVLVGLMRLGALRGEDGGKLPPDDVGPTNESPTTETNRYLNVDPAFPGLVSLEGSDWVDRCVEDPFGDVTTNLVDDPDYDMAYRSGSDPCSEAAAPTGKTGRSHRQGIQRLDRKGENYIIVSLSTKKDVKPGSGATGYKKCKTPAGFEVVQMGSKPFKTHEFGSNMQTSSCPWPQDHVVAWAAGVPELAHADGIQVLGNRWVTMGLAQPCEGDDSKIKAASTIWDLDDPTQPVLVETHTLGDSNVEDIEHGRWYSMVAITRITSPDDYLMFSFGKNGYEVHIYTFESGSSWFNSRTYRGTKDLHNEVPGWPKKSLFGGYYGYQNCQFLTQCNNGALYLACAHRDNGKDYLDLWRITFPTLPGGGINVGNPNFDKVESGYRHMTCDGWCHFLAGSGTFVDPDNQLIYYGVEHYDDTCNGLSVMFREFANSNNPDQDDEDPDCDGGSCCLPTSPPQKSGCSSDVECESDLFPCCVDGQCDVCPCVSDSECGGDCCVDGVCEPCV